MFFVATTAKHTATQFQLAARGQETFKTSLPDLIQDIKEHGLETGNTICVDVANSDMNLTTDFINQLKTFGCLVVYEKNHHFSHQVYYTLSGADLYIAGDINPLELSNIIKHAYHNHPPLVRGEPITISKKDLSVRILKHKFQLAPKEFALFALLHAQSDLCISKRDIYASIRFAFGSHIHSLRKKFDEAGLSKNLIRTHIGRGYSLDTTVLDQP